MTPEQIEAVRRTWSAARCDTDALVASVVGSMAGTEEVTAARARWAIDSITRLVLVLDHPAAFTAVAEAEIVRLPRVTLALLDEVRDAAIGALRAQLGGLSVAEATAWEQAFALFQELVAAEHLAPFTPPSST